jgi:hypothetical protein
VGATSVLNAVQMVLIHPKIIFDPLHPEGGVLRVDFPAEAELEAFKVPLAPSSETLETWERYVPSSLSSTTTQLGTAWMTSLSGVLVTWKRTYARPVLPQRTQHP